MTIGKMKLNKLFVACLLAVTLSVTLSACGESDLEEEHEQLLDDAFAAAQNPALGSADPDTDPDAEVPSPTSIDVSNYDLVFSDEFDGNSLDADNWSTSLFSSDTVIFEQLQYYVDTQNAQQTLSSPFTFNGQSLTISATKTPDDDRADANEQPYLSGLLTSREAFNFTYGYIEARVKVQAGLGIWPMFWMLGSNTDGISPEVYIFEYDGSKVNSVFHNYIYRDAENNQRSNGQREVQADSFSEGFQTVGLRWTPNELLYYVNGQPSYRVIGENVPKENMYLTLNLAMGGNWPGAPDGTTPDPATLEVDYVRIYQEKSQ